MKIEQAYYIKLGRGGEWESSAIAGNKLRLGWRNQSIEDVNAGRWELIEQQLRLESQGKLGVGTTDLNRLQDITNSGPNDVWVTFHLAKMWWTRLLPGPVEQDDISKFRRTTGWSDIGGEKTLFDLTR
ncbi:MAG: hypothetical protein EOP84_34245 [Verrucomicrobiaceae bacterium]|nr:MAG: hypothetical protein EOP84_34245 [Verrucomicrobiaceae bacterium]